MHIAIFGSGGVGGYFGARLVQCGYKVTFIARGSHLNAIRDRGLQLKSPLGDFHVQPCHVTSDFSDAGRVGLVLVCVKYDQLEVAAKAIAANMHDEMIVIPLLNGIENGDILRKFIPSHLVMDGLSKIVSSITAPGIITHHSYEPLIVFGEQDGLITERGIAVRNIFEKASIGVKLSTEISADIWKKFIFISTISALGALTRASVGEMMQYPGLVRMMKELATEIKTVGVAMGIPLTDDVVDKQFEIIRSQPYATTASLQRDVMQGKPSELEAQNGSVVRMAEKLGIEVPMNRFVYNALLPQENKARKTD